MREFLNSKLSSVVATVFSFACLATVSTVLIIPGDVAAQEVRTTPKEDRLHKVIALMHEPALCPSTDAVVAEWCRFHPGEDLIVELPETASLPETRPCNPSFDECPVAGTSDPKVQ